METIERTKTNKLKRKMKMKIKKEKIFKRNMLDGLNKIVSYKIQRY